MNRTKMPGSLKTQQILLRDFCELKHNIGGYDGAPSPVAADSSPPYAVGECFAIEQAGLNAEAVKHSKSNHEVLLELAVAGLWEEQLAKEAYVCYTVHFGAIRLFLCTHQRRFPRKFHGIVSSCEGYIESGRDVFLTTQARALAGWSPPCSTFALWPTGLDGSHDGARVVDTGNLIAWFSYPESDHEKGTPLHLAGPDYVRVPQSELSSFSIRDRDYHYFNRWVAVDSEPG